MIITFAQDVGPCTVYCGRWVSEHCIYRCMFHCANTLFGRVSPVALLTHAVQSHLSRNLRMEAYMLRRKKNNDAVQKCRAKKRELLMHWQQVCQELLDEQDTLTARRAALVGEVRIFPFQTPQLVMLAPRT